MAHTSSSFGPEINRFTISQPETPFSTLRNLHQTGTGGLFTGTWGFGSVVLGLSGLTDDVFWNNMLSDGRPSEHTLFQAEGIFEGGHRTPAVYMPVDEDADGTKAYMEEQGYELSYEDDWLVAGRSLIAAAKASALSRRVRTPTDLNRFIGALEQAHSVPEGTDNPYGELSLNAQVALKRALTLLVNNNNKEGDQCILIEQDRPSGRPGKEVVAVATVATRGVVSYIGNVGTVPGRRGQGFAREAVQTAIAGSYEAIHLAAMLDIDPVICLATERGQTPHQIFHHMGFKPWFSARGFVRTAPSRQAPFEETIEAVGWPPRRVDKAPTRRSIYSPTN